MKCAYEQQRKKNKPLKPVDRQKLFDAAVKMAHIMSEKKEKEKEDENL